MFSAKVSVVKSLMVLGKSLILAASIASAQANPINDPRFFEYRSGDLSTRLLDLSFGWFKSLDEKQKTAYYSSINHAVMFAENGQTVSWYENNASGRSTPVMTWPTGSGYCRRIHVQAIAYSVEKTMSATACFNNAHENWAWMTDK